LCAELPFGTHRDSPYDISGQRPEENMILKKGSMQLLCFPFGFSTRLPLPQSAYLSEIVIRVPVINQGFI
jgi:hypothetical protein